MDPVLDKILSEIILWRMQYMEATDVDDEEFEDLKLDYLRTARRIVRESESSFRSDSEFAEYLREIFQKAKDRASNESRALHEELDSFLNL